MKKKGKKILLRIPGALDGLEEPPWNNARRVFASQSARNRLQVGFSLPERSQTLVSR